MKQNWSSNGSMTEIEMDGSISLPFTDYVLLVTCTYNLKEFDIRPRVNFPEFGYLNG
jgi:hypothetical protein